MNTNVSDNMLGRRYRLTEKIGTGGMADVYKAVDEVLGRTVAVKVMHPRYAADPTFAARFRQEAQAAANLQSPCIVNIYDWGQEDSTYYIVMEYVRGTDLKSIILNKGQVDSKKVADIGAQVCTALTTAHGYDIIHRDIKPHNIMVTPDGHVKVMDFGIARAGNTTMTQTGSVMGTAHYVSPEQAQGRPLTNASDLYSLGIVLYEAATGTLPFDAETPVAVALKQVNEQPQRPTRINPNIDPNLERIIGKAMSKDVRSRYSSAEEMRQDLLRVVSGKSLAPATVVGASVGGAGAATVIGASAGRGPSDATTVLPVTNQNGAGNMARSNMQQMDDYVMPEEKSKAPWWVWVAGVLIIIIAGAGVGYSFGFFGTQGKVVPNVVGMTLEQATSEITDAGFVLGGTTEENSPDIEAGLVISQDPSGNGKAAKGAKITLVVSLGKEMGVVPDVVDLPEAEARDLITEAGFVPDSMPGENDKKIEAGNIISQRPNAETELEKGSKVQYVPSLGAEMVDVPKVVGKSRSGASAALTDADFEVKIKEAYSNSVAEDVVISQNPNAGLSVAKGTTITITVSKGKEITYVSVPDCTGLSLSAAKGLLKGLGFKTVVTYQFHYGSGNVISQSPTKGAEKAKGSTVTIRIDEVDPNADPGDINE